MSHSPAAIRFENGDIYHCEYNGTIDMMLPNYYDTYIDMFANWRDQNFDKYKTCEHPTEPIRIASTYGGGFNWKGTACRECKVIIDGISPHPNYDIGESSESTDYQNGLPDWYPNYDE